MTDLREALAAETHKAWSEWMEYMFSRGHFEERNIGHKTTVWEMPAWAVKRWTRQLKTSYADLPEDEKELDRKEADRYMLIMQAYMNELVRAAVGEELAHAKRVVTDLEIKMLPAAKTNGELRRLLLELAPYARHEPGCPRGLYPCTCGLQDLLNRHEDLLGEKPDKE